MGGRGGNRGGYIGLLTKDSSSCSTELLHRQGLGGLHPGQWQTDGARRACR